MNPVFSGSIEAKSRYTSSNGSVIIFSQLFHPDSGHAIFYGMALVLLFFDLTLERLSCPCLPEAR